MVLTHLRVPVTRIQPRSLAATARSSKKGAYCVGSQPNKLKDHAHTLHAPSYELIRPGQQLRHTQRNIPLAGSFQLDFPRFQTVPRDLPVGTDELFRGPGAPVGPPGCSPQSCHSLSCPSCGARDADMSRRACRCAMKPKIASRRAVCLLTVPRAAHVLA